MTGSGETADIRIKRLRMRSWRRGMREVDLLLGPFADASLGAFSGDTLDRYEDLLEQNDQDLYRWLSGASDAPDRLGQLVRRIAEFREIP